MLLWLRNIVPKRFQLLSKLCLLVSIAHMLLLALLFVGYKNQQAYALEIAKQLQINADTKIMFMPLYQTTKSMGKKNGGSSVRSGAPRLAAAARPRVKERAPTSLISDAPVFNAKKKKAALVAKAKKEKSAKLKKEAEKLKKETEKKEAERLKKEQELKKEAEKRAEKKIEPVPEPEKKEPLEQKSEEKREPEPAAVFELPSGSAAVQEGAAGNGQAGQDVVYVGQQEYDALGMQTYLQQELSTYWQPPQGIPADAECEVSFVVDWQGKAQTVTVSKPSGALVYDISARTALLAMEFPDWARGKSFKITFKQ